MAFKIDVLTQNIRNIHRKIPALESYLNKVVGLGLQACNFIKKSPTQVLSYQYCEIFKNTFFYRTPPVAASAEACLELCQISIQELFYENR